MLGCYLVRELHSTCCRSLQKPLISKCLETATKTTTPSKKTLTENRDAMIIKSPTSDWEVSEWNLAITTHMRNGQWESALRVFNCMPLRDSVSYNCMISGYLSNDKFDLARDMFEKMPERDMFSWNMMLNGYVKNRDLTTARAFFDQMPQRDGISWNAMLSGYAQNGYVHEARKFFDLMPFRNEISWNGLLVAYVQSGRIREAGALFQSKMDWEEASWNCLMSGYVKRKRLTDARRLFDRMPNRDVISWTTMITGYAQNGELSEARRLFEESPTRNVLTWTAMVSGYIQNGMLDEARRLFDRMPIRDEISWNTMITGYAQNGELSEALRLFEESPTRDVFTWTAMVSGYIQNGMLDEARRLFDEMPAKNEASWNAMIAGYVQCKRMDMARELFEAMPCPNKSSWNTMITGYAQNGNITQARYLFDKMPRRDCISWAAIITGYAQSGHAEEALHLFFEMKSNGEKINRSAFTCSLSACADIAALELGKQMHGWLVKAGYESDCYVGNALLAMYCKCGSIDEAYDVFDDILEKDVVSYNTMIAGYARHGFGKEALMVFESMKTVGVKPDDVTMVGVLSACNHSGLVEKGTKYFYSMDLDYGVTPNPKHYTCMIDLLGRAGRLDEAQNLMRSMPFMPDAATWGALLRASRIHGNTELGEKAAKIIFEMEPDNAGMYVLLSNLYAASGRWGDVSEMRLKMRDSGVKKEPGYSWLEAQNKIHTFSVGDHFHPDKDRIYAFLEELDLKMKLDGYVSSTKLVLHDVEEEEKEHMLKYHSEKLAVVFGILSIPAGRPIRVIKNFRVCEDCHNAIKRISKIEGRLIILRDSHRFHHFNGGSCSCGDYW